MRYQQIVIAAMLTSCLVKNDRVHPDAGSADNFLGFMAFVLLFAGIWWLESKIYGPTIHTKADDRG